MDELGKESGLPEARRNEKPLSQQSALNETLTRASMQAAAFLSSPRRTSALHRRTTQCPRINPSLLTKWPLLSPNDVRTDGEGRPINSHEPVVQRRKKKYKRKYDSSESVSEQHRKR